ncbi:hypothetical protein EV401DRAFT_1043330 [Pisolithus croceorrhizus]|nr:hypothetical protein EV401DRAFT_1043330 [Pisolithus croceorrhizus]
MNWRGGIIARPRYIIFCVSTTFHSESASSLPSEKYTSYAISMGRVFINEWTLEALDPRTKLFRSGCMNAIGRSRTTPDVH